MRQTISGLVAAVAVMTAGAAPAMACGFTACAPCASAYYYYSPCAWGFEQLADPDTQYYAPTGYYPTTQYYYVNQGPTYSGPGAFAPYPTYHENALPVYPYRWHRPWRHHYHGYRYGYGRPVLRRYY